MYVSKVVYFVAWAATALAAPSLERAAGSCPSWMVDSGPSYENYCCVYDSSLVYSFALSYP
jgi:hypothetical protein